jgi:hypothetical protein
VLLVFSDKHAFRIGQRAEVQLKELGQSSSYSFELLGGQIWSFVNKARKPAKYEVETPSTVLGVSGTLFSVDHNSQTNESEISVADGEVSARQGNHHDERPEGLPDAHTARAGCTCAAGKARQSDQGNVGRNPEDGKLEQGKHHSQTESASRRAYSEPEAATPAGTTRHSAASG